jgi:hypothetical protein
MQGLENVDVLVVRRRLYGQWMVEVVSRPDSAVVKGSGVWQDSITYVMTAHIGMTVGSLRSPQKRQTHQVSDSGKTVLGIIKNGNSVSILGQVSPLVAADFKFGHIPAAAR